MLSASLVVSKHFTTTSTILDTRSTLGSVADAAAVASSVAVGWSRTDHCF